jgi:hypothetical protein
MQQDGKNNIVFAVEDDKTKNIYVFSYDLLEFSYNFKKICLMNLISLDELSDKDKTKPKFNQ